MAPILNNQRVNLNGGDVNGINGGPTSVSSKVTAAVSGGNTQYQGLMKITSGGKGMSGGGRSRRHRRSHSSRRGSKKYARKRSLRHRLKHRKSGRRGHTKRRGQRGGAGSYSSNVALTFGQKFPGFPLLPNQSALANPPPFMPYRNCGSGK